MVSIRSSKRFLGIVRFFWYHGFMISAQMLLLIFLILAFAVFIIIYVLTSQLSKLRNELISDDEKVLLQWLKDMKISVDKSSDVLERQLQDQRQSLESQLEAQRKAMDQRTKVIWERLDKTSEVIQGVSKHLGGLQEFGKDMKDLSNILKSPKLRGGLGEQFLYEILDNFLPKELYQTQYRFKDGSVCDAVVKNADVLIPIDSKFPMENFKLMQTLETDKERESAKKVFIRDVKKRIDEISHKYILPQEGTSEQAIMYVPSETVYYELVVNTPEIEEYARQKNVFLTSPNTLVSFLNVLLVGHRRQELQEHAGEILNALAGIKKEAEKFDQDLGVLDGHLDRASKSMVNVKTKYQKLFGKIDQVQSLGEGEVGGGAGGDENENEESPLLESQEN